MEGAWASYDPILYGGKVRDYRIGSFDNGNRTRFVSNRLWFVKESEKKEHIFTAMCQPWSHVPQLLVEVGEVASGNRNTRAGIVDINQKSYRSGLSL